MKISIPVIDIFAGPGGLSEGFSAFRIKHINPFDVKLSIEADSAASETLKLRAFAREFRKSSLPHEYGKFARHEITLEQLYRAFPEQSKCASSEVWKATLGQEPREIVRSRIASLIADAKHWVLLGGPPCQAYSMVGRSRLRPVLGDDFDKDHRHFLYKEYLRILADHRPSVFVFENVKGILSSTVDGRRIFSEIVEDLERPSRVYADGLGSDDKTSNVTYSLHPIVEPTSVDTDDPRRFIVKSELHGVPQKRHRVIIVGVRSDLASGSAPSYLPERGKVGIDQVISDLPSIRSELSRSPKGFKNWKDNLTQYVEQESSDHSAALRDSVARIVNAMSNEPLHGTGASFIPYGDEKPAYEASWYVSPAVGGYVAHESRTHMPEDLRRYLFSSVFAKANGRSAKLVDLPDSLLPNHKNAEESRKTGKFVDRFRVQVKDQPASTITSHISKDGHYFIHYDPNQCRSLTVREAARVQTFPDDYIFLGTRTQQYTQVGNAVPPLLAKQIAGIAFEIIKKAF